jgi:hypothetical protein
LFGDWFLRELLKGRMNMKTRMKPAFFLLASLSIWFGFSGCSDSGSITVSPVTQTHRVHLINAGGGNMTPAVENGTLAPTSANEAVTFILEDVDKALIWYSDRPDREAGKAHTGQLINAWGSYYGETRPNAALSFTAPGTEDMQIIYLVMEKPEYDETKSILLFHGLILDSTRPVSPDDLTFETCVLTVLNNVGDGAEASTIIQHSREAVIDTISGSSEYLVTLSSLIPETVFVDNAPGRNSYAETVGPFFVDQWENRFADGLPNASLYGITESGELDIFILTLANPVIDQETDSIRYTASLLEREGEIPVSLEASILLIDSSECVTAVPDICNTTDGRTFLISNNCGTTSGTCTDKKSLHVSSGTTQFAPQCLQNMCAGDPPVTLHLPEGSNYAFWAGAYGSSTLCEVAIAKSGGWDGYNLSFNKGFDIGMTLVAPKGMVVPKIVAKTSKAYSAYPLPSTLPDCWAAPCTQPNYSHSPIPGGTYHLFLCNQPDETASTPGTYGCALNECPPECTDWTKLPCQGTPKLTGGDCALSCPGT